MIIEIINIHSHTLTSYKLHVQNYSANILLIRHVNYLFLHYLHRVVHINQNSRWEKLINSISTQISKTATTGNFGSFVQGIIYKALKLFSMVLHTNRSHIIFSCKRWALEGTKTNNAEIKLKFKSAQH